MNSQEVSYQFWQLGSAHITAASSPGYGTVTPPNGMVIVAIQFLANNTPTVIDRNEFRGDIFIKPNRSINFINLNFVAVASGVEFSEVVNAV